MTIPSFGASLNFKMPVPRPPEHVTGTSKQTVSAVYFTAYIVRIFHLIIIGGRHGNARSSTNACGGTGVSGTYTPNIALVGAACF